MYMVLRLIDGTVKSFKVFYFEHYHGDDGEGRIEFIDDATGREHYYAVIQVAHIEFYPSSPGISDALEQTGSIHSNKNVL